MKEGKLFLIEKGHIIVIRESAENEISFISLDEFASYLPEKDISRCYDYYYLDYEPERKVHFYTLNIDLPDAGLTRGGIPDKMFDDFISNFQLLKQRKDDPFWGKSLDEAREYGLQQVQMEVVNSIRKISSDIDFWRHEVGLKTTEEKTARNMNIKSLIEQSDVKSNNIEKAKTINAIKEIVRA